MPFSRRMRSLPLQDIALTDRFWSHWQRVLIETTLPAEYEQLVQTDRIENFRRAARGESGHSGLFFNDSDVYKWVEACAYALTERESESARGSRDASAQQRVRKVMDETIEAIAAAQEPDGYLNTRFQLQHPHLKWRNLNTMHEMYCGGHLIEAGVAVFECLGDRRLLDVSLRWIGHVMSVFGPEKRRGYCGHQELELALLRLSGATGDPKFKKFSRWMVEERGKQPSVFEEELKDLEAMELSPHAFKLLQKDGQYCGDYAQDHAPIREHTEIVGHAVRAMYFYIAATDLAQGQNDEALEQALTRIWQNLTRRRMYVTGGIGPSASNEGFTSDYDLPNLTAYAETCASIGLILWAHKLLESTGDSEYADIMERALYNGAISGISLSGDRFFYTNPLESRGAHERTPWFLCACCPPNIARLIGAVGRYVAGVSEDAFFIHIPAGFEANARIGGMNVRIRCESDYPWDGKVRVLVDPERPVQFAMHFRIPEWAEEITTDLPDSDGAEYMDGYAVFRKEWKAGDVLTVDLQMEPRWVEADPRVRDDLGRSALARGPLVFCAEDKDCGFPPQLFTADTEAPVLADTKTLSVGNSTFGVTTLSVEGSTEIEVFTDSLYGPIGTTDTQEAVANFLPYFAWNNRGRSNMQVWVRRL